MVVMSRSTVFQGSKNKTAEDTPWKEKRITTICIDQRVPRGAQLFFFILGLGARRCSSMRWFIGLEHERRWMHRESYEHRFGKIAKVHLFILIHTRIYELLFFTSQCTNVIILLFYPLQLFAHLILLLLSQPLSLQVIWPHFPPHLHQPPQPTRETRSQRPTR